jgi:hypothetical protein
VLGSTPRFIATSTVSSNFALARDLTTLTASSSAIGLLAVDTLAGRP